ncbi:ankyrin repeat domain-containing protein [Pseudidiomarina salilacus]|uniref:ankyrin repeat domain-containing protein n=1 Tax=Pseudidiomarina salilacus TaxID=3384452 RepID=UPI00398496F6
MKQAPKTTLFAPLKILKVWADGFGLRLTEKQRNELDSLHTAYNRYNHLIDEVIINQLKGLVTDSYLRELKQMLSSSISNLAQKLLQTSFFAMTPREIEEFIWGELYAIEFTNALCHIHTCENYLPSLQQMMSKNNSRHATAVALDAVKNDPAWQVFKSSLDKDAIDRLRCWRTTELASFEKIKELLQEASTLKQENQQRFFTILLHARLLDSFKPKEKENEEAREKTPAECLFEGILLRHSNCDLRLFLPPEQPRTNDEKKLCLWDYDLLQTWRQAKQDFENGDITKACKTCSELLELSICFGPEEQEALTHFSLLLGSMRGKKGDAPLLKKAKNLGIIFGFEQPHDHVSEYPKEAHKQLPNFVKQYEIEQWQRDCKKLFPNAKVDYGKVRPKMLIARFDELKFDLAKRKSRIGDSALSLEQLSQAIQHRQYDTFQALMAQTFRLDFAISERGYSPLVIALQNYLDTRSEADAEIVLKLLQKVKKDRYRISEIVGTRTDEQKLTPLGLAIQCNRPDFVEHLLALGADANQRLSEQFRTPLMHALNNFAHLRSIACEEEIVASKSIIKMLLDNAADPNLLHEHPGAGYHVGHFAAELNDAEIFDWLVKNDLNLEQGYLDPVEKRTVRIEHVAHYWQANHIVEYLQSRY